MNRIQALVLGLIVIVAGGILLVNAYRNYYDIDKKIVAEDNTRNVSCLIKEEEFVVANIYQNYNWTDPEGEGKYYDYGDDGVSQVVYAILNVTNQQGNSTSFRITYRLSGSTLAIYNIELGSNESALNIASVFDENGTYLFLGEPGGIACGQAASTGVYTFSLKGPGCIGGGERKSPPARFEVWTSPVTKVYPYYIYFMPTGIALIILGLGIPIVTTLRENKKGVASKRRTHLPKKLISGKS